MSIPSSELRWSGATSDQLAFMRRVYDAHVARAAAARTFVGDLPASALAGVENGQRMRSAAAAECRAMLATARADLANDGSHDVRWIGIASGYRSAREQFAIWQKNFRRYYADTEAERGQSDGGSHGDDAVTLLARYTGQRVAAPGYSLHNDGRAADLKTSERDLILGANTSQRTPWRQTWLWSWLGNNAARFHFFQNTHIDEPWHWEHRPASSTEMAEDAGAIGPGSLTVPSVPLLAKHKGSPPDLVLLWSPMANTDEVDVAVHFHGYSRSGATMNIETEKLPISGLDWFEPLSMLNPIGFAVKRRQRPTLFVLPRGNHEGGKTYRFPQLITASGFNSLVSFALDQFKSHLGLANVPQRKRLIITAHSGGGEAVEALLKDLQVDPDEIHLFDATYFGVANLIAWMQHRVRNDASPSPVLDAGALRILYRPGDPKKNTTQKNAQAVQRAITAELATVPGPTVLWSRYRAELTLEPHDTVAQRYGWQLFVDNAATLI